MIAALAFLRANWFAMLVAGLVLAALSYGALERMKRLGVEAEFANYKATYARSVANAMTAARFEQQRITKDIQKIAEDTHAKLIVTTREKDAALAARDSAVATARRMRQSAVRPGADPSQPGAGAVTAGSGNAGADPLDLLIGVFDRHSRELVEVGEYSDRLRIAGETCEREHDALIR